MSLLDDLRSIASAIDQQFQPTLNELPALFAAFLAHQEHGDSVTDASREENPVQAVTDVLAPPAEREPDQPAAAVPAPAGPGPVAATDPTNPTEPAAVPSSDVDELRRQVADLQAQVASRQATAQQTQVTHETGVAPDPSAPESVSSPSSDPAAGES